MSLSKQIVIIAGEESGDLHAAHLARELFDWEKNLKISGIGGHHMEQAGVTLISDLARYGVTGLTEIVRHFSVIRRAFKAIQAHLIHSKPDLLILVDYPGFNLRLAKFAKQLGIRVLYYISPQIWAWKPNRIHTIRETVHRMAVILPFEKEIYKKAQVPVSFVGHPLISQIEQSLKNLALNNLNLPANKKIIALLPGSRVHEVEKHLPVLIKMADKLNRQQSNLHFVIPVAKSLPPHLIPSFLGNKILNVTLTTGNSTQVMALSDCVVVASGTASLECALLEKPMCIIYKSSLLTYFAASKLINVKYLGLCNLLQNKMIVPELLQDDCNPHELTKMVNRLLFDQPFITTMKYQLEQLKQSLVKEIDCNLIELVKNELYANFN